MEASTTGYWARLWAALWGREVIKSGAECPPADEMTAECQARGASLEMDLAERDQQIKQMRSEYAALELAKQRASAGAGQELLEKLFKKLSGSLANLMALAAMAEAGREVEVTDLTQLIRGLEKELARAGLEAIGRPGEKTTFETAWHQRMSGGAVQSGIPVTIHLPGYRLGDKVLLKAMVSTREE